MKTIKNLVVRNESVVTGKAVVEPLFKLDNFPVLFVCTDSPIKDDLVAPMEWGIDKETGVIQLTKLIPQNILYAEQHADGVGKTWEEYYSDFADYVIKNNPKNVLEIGGGMGRIADLVIKRSPDTKWTIVEPSPLQIKNKKVNVIADFFDKNFKSKEKFDMVIFSQVMEHAYDPNDFVASIAKFLNPGQKLICAYPNLKLWLERKYTNAINFEHTMFLTDYFVDYLFMKHGFVIKDKTFYKDHSIFYTAEKVAKSTTPKFENKYDEYKKIFMDFVDYHKSLVSELNAKISVSKEPVYLFGAHIFSIFLFAFGLKKEKIVGIIDNSKLKNKRRLYGTNFIIDYPEVLKDEGKVNMILKAGPYNDEITKQLLSINKNVAIW